jgi:glycerophosphoryl diester phosphodiesterase
LSLRVVAHRGASGSYPENTLASFQAALDVGAEIVEMDVQLSRDGELVVIHDPTLDRTTGGSGRVGEWSLAEIRKLSAGFPDRFGDRFREQRVPTFAEALELVRGRAQVLVEIKPESVADGGDEGIEARTLAAIDAAGMRGGAGVTSFHLGALARCRELSPEVPRVPLFKSGSAAEMVAAARGLGAELALPFKGLLSDELLRLAREAGVGLAAWVVDDPEELRELARFELHGIGTNRPAEMLAAIRSVGATPAADG